MLSVEVKGFGDLAGLLEGIEKFALADEKSEQVAATLARMAQSEWRRVLTTGRSEIGLKNAQWGFAKGIRIRRVSLGSYRVVSDSKYSRWMGEQESDLDMKKTHPFGRKSRVSKKGTPYLIVPFVHRQPSAGGGMPQEVFLDLKRAVKRGGLSRVVKSEAYTQVNARGEEIFRSRYRWGGRTGRYGGDIAKYSGMVSMDQASISDYGSRVNRSSAFTFRVISAKSPAGSWIRKARPVVIPYVVKKLQSGIEEFVDSVLFEGESSD